MRHEDHLLILRLRTIYGNITVLTKYQYQTRNRQVLRIVCTMIPLVLSGLGFREFIFAHHYLRINVKQVQTGHKLVLEFS